MSASKSPLLRLPRELRDEIYRYAILEQAGYRYKVTSGRLSTFHNGPIDLSLSYTCKTIYRESRGLFLSTNCIAFTPQFDASSSPAKDKASISERLHGIQARHYTALTTMLSWMAEYVTSEHIDALFCLHPTNEHVISLRDLNDKQKQMQLKRGWVIPHGRVSISTLYALRDFVKLLSAHDAFYPTTAKEYDAALRAGQVPPYISVQNGPTRYPGRVYDDTKHFPCYVPGSQKELLERIIEPWRILEETELARLEILLPQKLHVPVSDPGTDTESDSDSEMDLEEFEVPEPRQFKFYFSATACAIQFLSRLRKDTLRDIRNISIMENHASLSLQASHPHGLIPFCRENPQLRVHTQVDIWDVLFWKAWTQHLSYITTHLFLSCTADCLREALLLPEMGMPAGQYTMELRGRAPEMTLHVWNGITKVAKVQDAATELVHRHPEQERPVILRYPPSTDFHTLVKRVLEGGTVISLEPHMSQPWDLDQAVRDLVLSPKTSEGWDDLIDLSEYEQQVEEFEALERRYTYIDE